jgi:muramoyltetrapeptide carboxypeptidase
VILVKEKKMVIFPERLTKGDTIGIISPSNPVTDEFKNQFDQGVGLLENLGFRIVIGKHVFSTSLMYAASPFEKAEDINLMFANPTIKAIICSQGGSTANACLPYLDWIKIQKNPKIFMGISDITVLLNAIHKYTGLITFHGNDVMWGFGNEPTNYDLSEFKRILVDANTGDIPANGKRVTVRGGSAEGKLLGGNLNCLLKLAGTSYFPDFFESILLVEAINLKPEVCDYYFHQLKQIGVFDQIKGVIIGFIDGLENDDNAPMQMEDILLHITADYDFPILKANDFGHNCPNTTFPIGGIANINADRRTIVLNRSVL